MLRPSFVKLNLHVQRQNLRYIHASTRNDSALLTFFGVAAIALGGSKALETLASRQKQQAMAQDTKETPIIKPFEMFSSLFSAKGFYQGGFEDTMTKREAALILGVRESSSREKIREAHRHLSRVTHPDTGGSPYLAVKINEAKDLLLGAK